MSSQPATRDTLFLGIDSSTQGLKAVAIDDSLGITHSCAVNFDADLPAFGTRGGAHHSADGLTVTAPTLMWVAALDLLLERLKAAGFPFQRVRAISGSGQQHGSVFLRRGTREKLRALAPAVPLREQLADAFAVAESPIWMDSSTSRECAERERALGGAQATAELTGSRAYERFTGNQIAKIRRTQGAGYEASERIQLVSSFVGSLLAGDYLPIDVADGAGMNLMELRTRTWSQAALDCTAPGLRERLGPLAASHTIAGRIHPYYTQRYGFAADCSIVVFSGDNPNSLAGLRLQQAGDVAISLGTSDTVFASLAQPAPSAHEGHIFASPIDPQGYMALMCWKNGSLTREDVRDRAAGGSWEAFNAAFDRTPAGNGGNIGFFIKAPEITPPILKTGIVRFDAADREVPAFTPDADVRAVVEGQFLSMRLHSANIGIRARSALATGGASANAKIVQAIADVFGVPVYRAEVADSAALGAAYRARHGWLCALRGSFVPFAEAIAGAPAFQLAAQPREAAHRVYSEMLARYAALEQRVIAKLGGATA